VDVALLLREEGTGWNQVMRQARVLKIERAVLQGARLAGRLLAAPVPMALLPSAEEEPMIADLAAEARRQIALEPAAANGTVEWFRQLGYRLRLQQGFRAKLGVLKPHLVSLSSWKMVRLPDRWFALYLLLTPFLWAWRKLRPPPTSAPALRR
jgi:hypothetical protein